MSMAAATRRSGLTLVILGVAGIAFFALSDPRIGHLGRATMDRWIDVLRGSPDNVVDAANQALVGTLIGITGSLGIFGVGCWLVTRRRA